MSRADSPLRDRVIFNVGARRSGTFWLQRVVTAHPEIAAVPSETHLFSHGIAPLLDRFQHAARSSPQVGSVYAERDRLLDPLRDLCDAVFAEHLDPSARYVAERTPLHVLHLDLIGEIYPDARVVHIIRDGRDVARSIAAQRWGPESIAEAAEEWRSSVSAGRAAGLGSERYRELRYEDLLAAPERTITNLYAWLGLAADPATVEQAAAEARRPANVDRERPGVGTGKWQDVFGPDDLEAFDQVAGELLAELGYEGSPRRRSLGAAGRSVAERARAAVHRLRASDRGAPEGPPRSPLANRQAVADRALEALIDGDLEQLAALMTPRARVKVLAGRERHEGRGEEGRARLAAGLAAAGPPRGRQIIGDVYPSDPLVAFVLSFEQDGERSDWLALVTVPSRRVTELSLYRFPLGR